MDLAIFKTVMAKVEYRSLRVPIHVDNWPEDAILTVGRLKNDPMLARIVSASYRSTACPDTIKPWQPNASHERIIVPRLPGLAGRSNTANNGLSPRGIVDKSSGGINTVAINSDVLSKITAVRLTFFSLPREDRAGCSPTQIVRSQLMLV